MRLPADLSTLAESAAFASLQRRESAGAVAGPLDLIHAFEDRAETFRADLPVLKRALKPAGAIWISCAGSSSR